MKEEEEERTLGGQGLSFLACSRMGHPFPSAQMALVKVHVTVIF
jgi:hypothetical protein